MEGTLVDIDERRRAAEALRASEQRTRAILENMLGGLIMVDGKAVIEFVNPAAERMFGYSGAELLGQSLQVLVPVKPSVDVGVFMRQAAEKAMGRVTEWEGRRKNGEVFPFELALFQFDTPGGLRVAGSIVDLTERRTVDRLKREFVSSISHELRTPLTSIRGSLGLLAGGALGPLPPEAAEIVAMAERNVVRLVGLINDILDLERLEGGRLEMEFEATETSPIVRRALEAVQSFADQSGVVLAAEPASARVRAGADRLVQVLVDLVSKAVAFLPAGGRVAGPRDLQGHRRTARRRDRRSGFGDDGKHVLVPHSLRVAPSPFAQREHQGRQGARASRRRRRGAALDSRASTRSGPGCDAAGHHGRGCDHLGACPETRRPRPRPRPPRR